MLKQFLKAIVIGVGFGIGFVVVLGVFVKIYFDSAIEPSSSNLPLETSNVPEIKISAKFLDSTGKSGNGFSARDSSILSTGPGKITGKVLANDKPVEGLQFRLALNGTVESQFSTTDENGQYTVKVPYGTYRIDGYFLNMDTAHKVLAGYINDPYMEFVSDEFKVDESHVGRGITLQFVDPIEKDFSEKVYSASKPILLEWTPYTGASHYSVQLYEKEDPYKARGNRGIFPHQSMPMVNKSLINISDYKKTLQPGYFYTVRITAYSSKGKILSYTPRKYLGYDFEALD